MFLQCFACDALHGTTQTDAGIGFVSSGLLGLQHPQALQGGRRPSSTAGPAAGIRGRFLVCVCVLSRN